MVSVLAAAFKQLWDILNEMAKGNAVTLIPVRAELTSQQAAELLGVSRPFVVEQLEKGNIRFRNAGTYPPSIVQRFDGIPTFDGS